MEITAVNSASCLISKERARAENLYQISNDTFRMISYTDFRHEYLLYLTVLHTHEQKKCTLHCAPRVCHRQ
jgi:hypothetical protein